MFNYNSNNFLKNYPELNSPHLQKLSKCLLFKGDELRIVGGAVRDALIKRENQDVDLACKLTPLETIKTLEKHQIKTIPTGIKYGTITAIIKINNNQSEKHFQITSLREDTENFGRSCQVNFVDDFYQDAKRRDFTINAMSVDFFGNFYDYFNGKSDLENEIVRFIGDANQRIKEDNLRILRFFRFSCFYSNKKLDESGFLACSKNADLILNLSKERIRGEFFKILSCENRENLYYILSRMNQSRILSLILGEEVNLYQINNLFHLETILGYQFPPLILLACLCYKPQIILSRAEKKYLKKITELKFKFEICNKDIVKLIINYDKKTIADSFVLKLVSSYEYRQIVDRFLEIKEVIFNSKIPPFLLNGNDFIEIGIKPQNIGKVIKEAKDYWIEQEFKVTKQQIIEYILKIYC